MNINKPVRKYITAQTEHRAGRAEAVCFITISHDEDGDIDFHMSRWLDRLRHDTVIVGVEPLSPSSVLVCFVSEMSAAE